MSEQLTLDESDRQGRHAQAHERAVATRAEMVNGPSEQFLAGPGLARSSTVESVGATVSTACNTRLRAGLSPMMSLKS